jgi:hypothetical protein
MNRDVKVAVCLSGLTRSLQYCWETIEKHLVEPYNADIFLHTWDINVGGGGAADRFGQAPAFHNVCKEVFFEQIKKKYGNRFHYQVEKFEDKQWNFLNVADYANITPMFYSIYKCNELRKSIGDYDLVIRSRMDTYYETPIPVEEFTECLNTNKIFVRFNGINKGGCEARNHFIWAGQPFVCDNFAIGNNYSMNVYASTYTKLNELLKIGTHVSPESCLGLNLKASNIRYDWSKIMFKSLIGWDAQHLTFQSFYKDTQTILMKNYG